MREYIDEGWCPHCDKYQQMEFRDNEHERDCSYDKQTCLECGAYRYGMGDKWEFGDNIPKGEAELPPSGLHTYCGGVSGTIPDFSHLVNATGCFETRGKLEPSEDDRPKPSFLCSLGFHKWVEYDSSGFIEINALGNYNCDYTTKYSRICERCKKVKINVTIEEHDYDE